MELPNVLREGLQPLPPPNRRRVRAAAATRSGSIAGYELQPQEQDQWCWAAVAQSIAVLYDRKTRWKLQCVIAGHVLGRHCCTTESPNPCNEPQHLEHVLQSLGLPCESDMGAKSLEEIAQEIDAGHPVACYIELHRGGAHYVVICGYDLARGVVFVKDPFFGDSVVDHEVFCAFYQGVGGWTKYFLTQPPPPQPGKRRAMRS